MESKPDKQAIDEQNKEDVAETSLCETAQRIYDEVYKVRCNAINLTIQLICNDKNKEEQYIPFIAQCGPADPTEFSKYTSPRKDKVLLIQHRCRAIAKFLRTAINKHMSINVLFQHDAMKQIGLAQFKAKPRTFREWMKREGIHDR